MIGVDLVRVLHAARIRCEVSNDLVAVEIEVDPTLRATAFLAAENAAIKLTCCFEIVDGESEVE